MTYREFKNAYKWLVKHYPETTNFYSETLEEIIGKVKKSISRSPAAVG